MDERLVKIIHLCCSLQFGHCDENIYSEIHPIVEQNSFNDYSNLWRSLILSYAKSIRPEFNSTIEQTDYKNNSILRWSII